MGNIFKTQITCNCDAVLSHCLDCVGGRWMYVSELERNLKCLVKSVDKLGSVKNDTMTRISIAETQGKKCLEEVQLWLSTVSVKIAKSRKLLEKQQLEIAKLCIGGCCSKSCISSYKFGKKVDRRLKEVNDLVKQGKEFKEVAIVALPEPMVVVPVGPTVGLESKLDIIHRYLLDTNVCIVGISGEAEVGKTTLLKEVNNIICIETSYFDLAILIDVSNQSVNESIQNDIGKKIGFSGEEWTRKGLYDKAVDILNVLKRKKFVLLLDNVFEALNLTELGIPSRKINMSYKIVFTTQLEKVCSQMRAQKIVKVEPLGFEDSWGLFSDRIGEDIMNANPEIYDLAKELVGECGGLPIVLIKWAEDMACKSTTEDWTDALKSLRVPSIDSQEIIESSIAIEEEEDDESATTLEARSGDTNVFGRPITEETLKEMPQFAGRRWISAKHKAGAALDRKRDDEKDVKARAYVRRMKMKYGDDVATIGLFYNATGCSLTYSGHRDWYGHLSKRLQPMQVENGQWGVLLHMLEDSTRRCSGSSGGIVYSGENASGDKRDWLLAWNNPSDVDHAHAKVFTEVRPKDHFYIINHWPKIQELLSAASRECHDDWGDCVSSIALEENVNGVFFEATFSLKLIS